MIRPSFSSTICSLLIATTPFAAKAAEDVCLKGPGGSSEVWLRTASGRRTGEQLPGRQHAIAHDVGVSEWGDEIVEVELENGSLAWVSHIVIQPPSACGSESAALSAEAEPEHPEFSPSSADDLSDPHSADSSVNDSFTADSAPSSEHTLIGDGESNDPFGCSTAVHPENCNREALTSFALQGKKRFSYREAREELFQFVDVIEEGHEKVVLSLYSQETHQAPTRGVPNPDVFNTEHVFPQSRLRKKESFETSRTDLFHLFTCASWINSKRSSLPFDNIDFGQKIGESELTESSFEPPDRSKGVVARAMMYVALVYSLSIGHQEEATLRSWNEQYPVSTFEWNRSQRVTESQGNRNPFVLHPEWANLISDF